MPVDLAAVVAYVAERTEQGVAAPAVRGARPAIGAAHRDAAPTILPPMKESAAFFRGRGAGQCGTATPPTPPRAT